MWSPETKARVLERIAAGESVRQICRDEGMPSWTAIARWLKEDASFREQYVRAKEDGAEAMADDILEIADNASNDWMERNDKDNPGWVFNGEAARRSQIRIDARKWLLAKTQPKKYGDRLDVDANVTCKVDLLGALKALREPG